MHVHLKEEMKLLIAILLSLVKPSYQKIERFQQRPFQIIQHKQGQVCLSNTVGWYTAPTVRACASLISMEQSQNGATVFTFDSTHFICRTYIEEKFNVCFFEVCSGCVSYKFSNSQDSTSTAYYLETSSVALTVESETSPTTGFIHCTDDSQTTIPSLEMSTPISEPDLTTTSGFDSPETTAKEAATTIYTENPETNFVTHSMVTTTSVNTGKIFKYAV